MTSMPRTESEIQHAAAVREMFSGIAGRYDFLNHLLSANVDKRWRRKVRAKLEKTLDDPNAIVLDVACGTGDLSIELHHEAKARVIGTDFCRPMLSIAKEKEPSIPLVEGDAQQMHRLERGESSGAPSGPTRQRARQPALRGEQADHQIGLGVGNAPHEQRFAANPSHRLRL